MPKRITITEKRREAPDLGRLVHALLLLARGKAADRTPKPEARHDEPR